MIINKIPVTILTGFLGSGKTTLLNAILAQASNFNFAIIENEIGQINIDKKLLQTTAGIPVYELTNGCICCTVGNDFEETLVALLNSETAFNHVLIETTGIADPTSVIRVFFKDAFIAKHFYLNATVCIADSINFDKNLLESEVQTQLLLADYIILNKISEIEKPSISIEKIKQINANAFIETCDFGRCNVNEILNLQAFDAEKVLYTDFKKLRLAPSIQPIHKGFGSFSFILDKPINAKRFAWWMEYFLSFNSQSVFRAKGIIWFENEPKKFVFQAVRSNFIIEETDYWRYNETKQTELVFIGRNLDAEEIQKALNQLVEV